MRDLTEYQQRVQKSLTSSITSLKPFGTNGTFMKSKFHVYTTANSKSLLMGDMIEFSLTDNYDLVYSKISSHISSSLNVKTNFELILYLPGGIPFLKGDLSTFFEYVDVVKRNIYVVVTKPMKEKLNQPVLEPCSCKSCDDQLMLSPFFGSTRDGYIKIACLLGYIYYGGVTSQRILLTIAKLTVFAPLILNIFRLIEKAPLNIRNIVSITGALQTFFCSLIPEADANQIFERTFDIITYIDIMTDVEPLKIQTFDWNSNDRSDDYSFQAYFKKI